MHDWSICWPYSPFGLDLLTSLPQKKRMSSNNSAFSICIKGLVQGVGFRPFVYRMAMQHQIKGWVENNNEGVTIHAEGHPLSIQAFSEAILKQSPEASHISLFEQKAAETAGFTDFSIRKSSNLSNAVTEVSPDIAVCPACLEDMQSQPQRLHYPFINCTNCGPRFSIIRALPYDRPLTSMDPFVMCPQCASEYTDILDRRFHAQPVACLHCGPAYILPDGKSETNGVYLANLLAEAIDNGKIVALKGMGGFHLICDATNETAVRTLRTRKQRDGKPMAVMVANLESAHHFFTVNPSEEALLQSWRRPIVLLNNKLELAPSVSRALNSTGLMLPYMPLHYQLFDQLKTKVIVMTSGNISDEPVLVADDIAREALRDVADLVVGYNRHIVNRVDDSVVFVANEKPRLIRRSRSYAPAPIQLQLQTEGIFAAGAELVNTFGLGKGSQIILSQHIGDLKNAETMAFYEESFGRFQSLFRFTPALVACDSHPDYLSSQFARSLQLPTIEVQHHHAHIASCMAEHGLDEAVIGIALDGTGWGDDGTIWGGEYFLADLNAYQRMYHFDPVPLPGGDMVTKQPWRTAFSYLYKYFGMGVFIEEKAVEVLPDFKDLPLLAQMVDKQLNCPLSSGAGRLFDAVAALLGLCRVSSYHAEAPMRLEAAIEAGVQGKYLLEIDGKTIVFRKLFRQMLDDLNNKMDAGVMAAKFHNTIVALNVLIARKIRKQTNSNKVVLSGGSFQNKYLLEHTEKLLKRAGFEVFAHQEVPTNDGGIALGQLAIAAKRRAISEHNTSTKKQDRHA